MSDERPQPDPEERNPFADLSNKEMFIVAWYYIRKWFSDLVPLASEVEDDEERFVHFRMKQRRFPRWLPAGRRMRDEKGDRRVMFAGLSQPLIIAGRRVRYPAFLIGAFGLIIVASLIRALLSPIL